MVGNVKSLLTIISKIPFQNAWYLPGGITESDVIAAYQFVNRRSASDALVNINQGEEYVLTLSDENTITWDIETGFKLPASTRLVNDLLISESGLGVLGSIKTAAFGFSVEPSTGSGSVGGIMLAPKKVLMVWRDFDSITDGPAIYRAGNSGQRATSVASCPVNGVLGGNFGSSSVTPEIYLSGTKLATEGHNSAPTITTSAGIGNPSGALSPLNLTCVVLYSKALTAEQHQNLSEKITALGGLS